MNEFVRKPKYAFVPLDEIDVGNTIRPYNATVVAELAQSIKTIGLQTPLTCIIRDERHVLVTGRNRLEALRLVKAEQAPVRIVDFTDVEAQLWQISENLHRAELTKLQYDQQVVKYAQLLKAKLKGQSEIDKSEVRSASSDRQPVQLAQQCDEIAAAPVSSSFVARELNITREAVRRAYQTASLAPEAQEAAVETGLDDNRSALLEAAKERRPETQVETIRRIAEQKASGPAPEAPPRWVSNLDNLEAGKLARWIIASQLVLPHIARMLRATADLLESNGAPE